MNQVTLKKYQQQIKEMIRRIQPDALAASESTRDPMSGQAAGELSNAPMHLGDMGTEEYLRDLNATLLENEEYLIEEAFEALRRIEEGTFGRCAHCGRPIPTERLDAIPYARYCATCSAALNPGPAVNLNAGRPANPSETISGLELADESPFRDDEDFTTSEIDPELAREGTQKEKGDVHAAGTAGGGTAIGGLAGSNVGHGEPAVPELEEASGGHDDIDEPSNPQIPLSGRAGGAVGGTPVNKRAPGVA